MHRLIVLGATLATALGGCKSSDQSLLLGTLERERVAVTAQASERITRIDVAEGDEVHAGDPILSLDPRRSDARIEQGRAEVRHAQSALAELRNGSRIETIDVARADLAGELSSTANAQRERDRLAEIRKRGLIAQADLDRAENTLRNTAAQRDAARARLAEQLAGTRIEDIEQAEAMLSSAQAALDQLELDRARYDVVAPRDGRIDALPFKLGDQPASGAVLVSLLAGPIYARVYVPASQRPHIRQGSACTVSVSGTEAPFRARVRSIRSDPAFTPYFALTGDDASRLAYRAELVLETPSTDALAAGIPAQAQCNGSESTVAR
ncbi:MAG: HlyD family efflux transporter periplasmic adaptor subunit [Xanthomonadales bacterium]|nr:HlyD family efflux transporter periplasmic adaptor subunit [Xanthomonadales bacterium]